MKQTNYVIECLDGKSSSFYVLRVLDPAGKDAPQAVACGPFEEIARYFGNQP